jgi:hypothetical protein
MRRGWVFIDALWGMILISMIAGIFATAMNRRQVGLARLADSRAACRLSEEALIDLQEGRGLPPLSSDESLRIVKLDAQGTWVRVEGTVRGRDAQLIGYLPRGANP